MKNLFLVLCLLGVSVPSFAAQLVWTCESSSDPDKVDIDIWNASGKYYAVLQEYYGDGDSYAEDLIEVRRVDDGNDAVVKFEEVGTKNRVKGIRVRKPTGNTEGAVLTFSPFSKSFTTTLKGKSGPSGNDLSDEGLDCTQPKDE